MTEITIPLRSNDEAILVLGPYDRYAKLLRQALGIELFTRRGNIRIKGEDSCVGEARERIEHLLGKARKGRELEVQEVESILMGGSSGLTTPEQQPLVTRAAPRRASAPPPPSRVAARALRSRPVEPRTENQRAYFDLMSSRDLVFALGVAGTGKTFLAVAAAVAGLRTGEVQRLIITRPVVEAGEHLGFLPGDLQDKLDPYMRPIYDALHTLLDADDVARLEENNVIEIAPLAYMRGRTLSDAFVILDEGQNATVGQMKMFLTRLGERSKMVVTGDPSQTDLVGSQKSGLLDAVSRLRGFQGVGVAELDKRDIVRHPLVANIVRAYEGPPPAKAGQGEESGGRS
ncbi:MAG: PhoH family protein [Planctomycetes bacterium]|nr:PhoH family protein [Planctomycetota bacterium]